LEIKKFAAQTGRPLWKKKKKKKNLGDTKQAEEEPVSGRTLYQKKDTHGGKELKVERREGQKTGKNRAL